MVTSVMPPLLLPLLLLLSDASAGWSLPCPGADMRILRCRALVSKSTIDSGLKRDTLLLLALLSVGTAPLPALLPAPWLIMACAG
jgi:hypothetical protein